MASLYLLYVALLLIFEIGTLWLNIAMLAITVLYIIFLVLKLTTLNRMIEKKGTHRRARKILKYSKWSMKIINAVFVVLLIATTRDHDMNNVFLMIGVLLVLLTFIFSVMWDVLWYIARKRATQLRQGWDNLSREEKNTRISTLLEEFMHSLDYITGADITDQLSGQRPKTPTQSSQPQSPTPMESPPT